mmetsp:Transcript_56693/g.64972  ORF Transcript_56693/g.64972 Transcript_56693/m.64972 type:complete len:422 (+) Transcript_56693:32-1297(+)
MYSEEITAAVIDIGNGSCRAGSSGEDTPKYILPSVVGVLENKNSELSMDIESEQTKNRRTLFAGEHQIKFRRDNMEIVESIRNGQYLNFELIEKLINDVYYENLQILPSKYPLLMSEPSIPIKEQRQKMIELAFEKFATPAYYVCKSAVLSCFASGRSTSLILDSGASHTIAVPVNDGYALQKSTISIELGGNHLTQKVLKAIEEDCKTAVVPRSLLNVKSDEEGTKKVEYVDYPNTTKSYLNYMKLDIARDAKETLCRLVDVKQEGVKAEKLEYELPDGKTIDLGDSRYTLGEMFFNPVMARQDFKDLDLTNFKGLHHMVMESINKCDIDVRKELLSNIILTGGNSLLNGLYENLQKKIFDIAPQNAKVKITASPLSAERKFSTWIGGSILSSLGSFQNMWISKAEYDEIGSYVVEKKCP